MGFNLTDEFINLTFEQLTQISGSVLVDGTGSAITSLDVTASNAIHSDTAISALTASYLEGSVASASYAATASFVEGSIASASYASTAATASFLLGNAEGVSHVDFTNTAEATTERRLTWNDTDGTLNVGLKGGNVTLQVGQEEVARVVNGTAADLLESQYRVVKVVGAQGQRLQVQLAQADSDLNSASTLGVVTENIAKNQEGFVTTAGIVRGINTTGALQGETWNDGDVLYLSGATPGVITNVKPLSPTHLVVVGYVVYAHATQGKIYVKVDNGYEIEELHDVLITSASDGQVLLQSGGLWINADAASWTGTYTGDASITGSLTVAGDLTATNATFTSASIGYLTSITGSAKVIGDAFVVVNSDLPTQRYAGLSVYDSGSALTTGSFFFDGELNDWNYEYQNGSPTYAVAMFGPEYTTKGSPVYPTTNRLVKGNGHHLEDSSISDDGSAVSSSADFYVTGRIDASGIIAAEQRLSVANNNTGTPDYLMVIADGGTPKLAVANDAGAPFVGGANVIVGGTAKFQNDTSFDAPVTFNTDLSITGSVAQSGSSFTIKVPAPSANVAPGTGYGSQYFLDFVDLQTSENQDYDHARLWAYHFTGSKDRDNRVALRKCKQGEPVWSELFNAGYQVGIEQYTVSGSHGKIALDTQDDTGNGVMKLYAHDMEIGAFTDHTGSMVIGNSGNQGIQLSTGGTFAITGSTDINGNVNINVGNGAFNYRMNNGNASSYTNENSFGWIDNSFGSGYIFDLTYGINAFIPGGTKDLGLALDLNAVSSGGDTQAGIYAKGAGGAYYDIMSFQDQSSFTDGRVDFKTPISASAGITGELSVDGGLSITGSAVGNVTIVPVAASTGSIDASTGNFFTLDLPSGDTHITMINVSPGQTINLRLVQNGAGDGTFSFDNGIMRWQGGTPPTASSTANHTDIISFVTFDSSNVYGSAVLDFS